MLMHTTLCNCRYSELGSGTIWLTNLGCSSSDLMLSTCSHSGFGSTSSCSHSEDVAVTCNTLSTNEYNYYYAISYPA
jgi:hypothetical protein